MHTHPPIGEISDDRLLQALTIMDSSDLTADEALYVVTNGRHLLLREAPQMVAPKRMRGIRALIDGARRLIASPVRIPLPLMLLFASLLAVPLAAQELRQIGAGPVLPKSCVGTSRLVDIFFVTPPAATTGTFACNADGVSWTQLNTGTGVPTTRSIATTAPLAGGGDFSINRTHTIATAASGVAGVIPSTGLTAAMVAAANVDGTAGVASLRTLGTGAQQGAAGNDSRLSDARAPTAHATTHASAGSDPVTLAPSQVTGTAVVTADSRLSDARTPIAHAASHQNGGADEIATATAAANAIPKAGSGGTLASGWIPTLNQNTTGTATNASNVAIANDNATNATMFPLWVTASTGNLPPKTSSTFLVFNPTIGVGIGSGSAPMTKLTVWETINTSPRGILSGQSSADTSGARVGFAKSRGTQASPTTIVSGDTLGRLMFRGHDGTGYLEMASIEATSSGTIATNRVPTFLAFSTATDAAPSVLTERMRIASDGTVTMGAYGAGVGVFSSAGVVSSVAPSTSGNVLTSNGTAWTSATPASASAPFADDATTALVKGTADATKLFGINVAGVTASNHPVLSIGGTTGAPTATWPGSIIAGNAFALGTGLTSSDRKVIICASSCVGFAFGTGDLVPGSAGNFSGINASEVDSGGDFCRGTSNISTDQCMVGSLRVSGGFASITRNHGTYKPIEASDLIVVPSSNNSYSQQSAQNESLTLSTLGTTTATSGTLAAANTRIKAITYRITTTIATSTAFTVSVTGGNAFCSIGTATTAQSTLTSGTTGVLVPCAFPDQFNGSATTLTVTVTGVATAGVIRLTTQYETFVPPSS